jgi:hypothetical protein
VQIDYDVVHLRTSLVQLFVLLQLNFEEVVQIIELRRFRGAPNGYPFAALTCWHLNPLQPQGKLLEHLELSKYKMKNTWSSQAHSNTAASSCCKHSECGEMNCLAALHLAEYIYTKFYLLPATKVH